jgi:hypothetical protein
LMLTGTCARFEVGQPVSSAFHVPTLQAAPRIRY